MKEDTSITIRWYGRCCFTVNLPQTTILFDPYDTFNGIDIGYVDSDICLLSSTSHDHGHIGASPKSYVYSYPGIYKHDDVQIVGIEARENRGTPTIIYNVQFGNFSITNFADFGAEQQIWFDQNVDARDLELLKTTNIAFVRGSILGDRVETVNIHNEIVLNYCSPQIIIPEHYHPRSFIEKNVPSDFHYRFSPPNTIIDEMPNVFTNYTLEEHDDYQIDVDNNLLQGKNRFIRLMRIHEQVKWVGIR